MAKMMGTSEIKMAKATAGRIPWMIPTAVGPRLFTADKKGRTLLRESKLEMDCTNTTRRRGLETKGFYLSRLFFFLPGIAQKMMMAVVTERLIIRRIKRSKDLMFIFSQMISEGAIWI